MTSASAKSYSLFAGCAIAALLVFAGAANAGQPSWIVLPYILLFLYAAWQKPHFAFLLLAASLPLSIELNITPSLGTDVPDEPLMWLCSFLFLALLIRNPALAEKEKFRHPLVVLLVATLSWAILSSLFSIHFQNSVKYILAKGWYVATFVFFPFILLKNKKQFVVWTGVLLCAMIGAVLIVMTRHAYGDFRFATVHEAVTPLFRNHVNYAAMLVCCIPVFVAAQRLSDVRYRRLFSLVLIFLLAALFFSYSRGAWLALFTGLATYWLIKKHKLLIAYIAVAVSTILLFCWISSGDRYLKYAHEYKTTIFHTNFSEHLVATYTLKDVSTAERFYRWTAAIRMIKENPVTGTGPNTFYPAYKPYAVPAYKTWVSNNPDHSTVHNYFLLMVTEQGVPGLVLFLFLLGALFYYTEKIYRRTDDPFYKQGALAAGVILVMICTLNFLSDLIETDKIGSLFFLCISFLVMADVNTRKRSEPSSHIQRIP
ncbi:MAG: O-antigen ligase family protein [Chitinophagaceae bacterium]|nr:O-antigen ligase family protein [Chitinophagaceae bacterium]